MKYCNKQKSISNVNLDVIIIIIIISDSEYIGRVKLIGGENGIIADCRKIA